MFRSAQENETKIRDGISPKNNVDLVACRSLLNEFVILLLCPSSYAKMKPSYRVQCQNVVLCDIEFATQHGVEGKLWDVHASISACKRKELRTACTLCPQTLKNSSSD